MPGVDEIINKIKGFLLKPKPGAANAPVAAASGTAPKMAGVLGQQKPGFDINMYMKAVQLFFKDFFGKKVPAFFKNPGPYLKNFPVWWGGLKQDEQISYGVFGLGSLMFVTGIVLFIVL